MLLILIILVILVTSYVSIQTKPLNIKHPLSKQRGGHQQIKKIGCIHKKFKNFRWIKYTYK